MHIFQIRKHNFTLYIIQKIIITKRFATWQIIKRLDISYGIVEVYYLIRLFHNIRRVKILQKYAIFWFDTAYGHTQLPRPIYHMAINCGRIHSHALTFMDGKGISSFQWNLSSASNWRTSRFIENRKIYRDTFPSNKSSTKLDNWSTFSEIYDMAKWAIYQGIAHVTEKHHGGANLQ